jgi:hypothetical protein
MSSQQQIDANRRVARSNYEFCRTKPILPQAQETKTLVEHRLAA